jgi:hypothetical protein
MRTSGEFAQYFTACRPQFLCNEILLISYLPSCEFLRRVPRPHSTALTDDGVNWKYSSNCHKEWIARRWINGKAGDKAIQKMVYEKTLKMVHLSPVFLSLLCAHALCSCFVLRAHALCLSGFLVTARQARSTKHAHGADDQQQQADAVAHKNRVFLSRTAKHKA